MSSSLWRKAAVVAVHLEDHLVDHPAEVVHQVAANVIIVWAAASVATMPILLTTSTTVSVLANANTVEVTD